jgi:hypothetical protein
MKHLSHSVNIIPIIAKADTMTIEERLDFKQRVRKPLPLFRAAPPMLLSSTKLKPKQSRCRHESNVYMPYNITQETPHSTPKPSLTLTFSRY